MLSNLCATSAFIRVNNSSYFCKPDNCNKKVDKYVFICPSWLNLANSTMHWTKCSDQIKTHLRNVFPPWPLPCRSSCAWWFRHPSAIPDRCWQSAALSPSGASSSARPGNHTETIPSSHCKYNIKINVIFYSKYHEITVVQHSFFSATQVVWWWETNKEQRD